MAPPHFPGSASLLDYRLLSSPLAINTSYTQSLQQGNRCAMGGGSCVKVSTQHFLSATPSFLHFFPAPAWMLHRPVLLGISICCSMGSSTGCTGYLLCHGAPPPPPLTLVLPLLFITSPTPLLGIFCPFLNMLSPTPLARLMGSAVSCSGLILEPAESGTGQLLVLSHRDHPAATLPFTPNTWFYMYDVRRSDGCAVPSSFSLCHLNKLYSHLWMNHICSRWIYFCRGPLAYATIHNASSHLWP